MSTETQSPIGLPTTPYNLIGTGKKCKCRCIRRPIWYINPITELVNVADNNKKIPLKSSHLDAHIHNSIANIKYSQTYTNTEKDNPIECIYKFPCDPYFSVTGMHIKLDDKEIDAVILEKEEAKEKYDDAIAAGHTAAKINYDENIPDVIELAIGSLMPEKTVTIDVQMVAKCDVIMRGLYSFIFPVNFIPRYYPEGTHAKEPRASGDRIPGKFSSTITIDASNVISDLSASHMMSITQSESGKRVVIKIDEDKDVIAKDIAVSYSTDQIREPTIVLHQSSKHPDEVAAHVSFIPRVSDELELDDDEEMKDQTNIDGTKVETELDEQDDIDVASGEFIFVLDRSGSMRGKRIELAVEALKLFIKSLPSDSVFNIISFGSRFESLYKQSVKYTKENIESALIKLSSMAANMGGTQMLEPLENIYAKKFSKKFPRNIFLLTDGAIGNTDQVVAKIRENNYSTRVHTFGIGSGASRYLVKETAKAGLGTSALIADGDSKIKEKVIQALNLAAKPAFTDIKVNWNDNQNAVQFACPRDPITGNIYEEEPFNIYGILKKSDIVNSDLDITYFNTFTQSKGSFKLSLNPEDIIEVEDDDSIYKIAAKENMLHIKRSKEEAKLADTQLLDLSLKYSVLCDKTAFFGKIKNKEKSTGEMKTIEIPIKKIRDNSIQFYGGFPKQMLYGSTRSGGRGRGGRGGRGGVMMHKRLMCAMPMTAERNRAALKATSSLSLEEAGCQIFRGCSDMPLEQKSSPMSSALTKKKKSKKKANKPIAEADLGVYASSLMSNERCMEDDEEDFGDSMLETCKAPTSKKDKQRKSSLGQGNYQALVASQEPLGYFQNLPSTYKDLIDSIPPSELSDIISDPETLQLVWTTILVLLLLDRDCKDTEGEWKMIAKKARTYIKKQGVKDYKFFSIPS